MSEFEFNCPTHGVFKSKMTWWAHGDDCSDMCVECEPYHTSDVGCRYVNVSLDHMTKESE